MEIKLHKTLKAKIKATEPSKLFLMCYGMISPSPDTGDQTRTVFMLGTSSTIKLQAQYFFTVF